VAIRYAEPGHADEILALLAERKIPVSELTYDADDWSMFSLPPGDTVVDVTGLAKPVLFGMTRKALKASGNVWVAHTAAVVHYPLNEEIDKVFRAGEGRDQYELLEAAAHIWYGEREPYSFIGLLPGMSDPSRRRVLCAAASAKHQRLSTLVSNEQYDHVEIAAPPGDSPRNRLARLAADVAARGLLSAHVELLASDDLAGQVSFLTRQFADFYIAGGFEIELGLTGSKMHAIACAVASEAYRPSQCWYVKPAGFDPERFTTGTGDTHYCHVTLERSR
jgi:hypothetical protein